MESKRQRQHKTLSLVEKFEILNDLKCGISGKQLALKYGVGSSTISDIKKNEDKIRSFVSKYENVSGNRKTLKPPKYSLMEAKLYSWYTKQRNKFIPVSWETLARRAKLLCVKYYGPNDKFLASRGWIENFKHRYGLTRHKIHDENLSISKIEWVDCESIHRQNDSIEDFKEEEKDVFDSNETKIKHNEAFESFAVCLEWAHQNNIALSDVNMLNKLKEIAFEKISE